MPVPHTAASSAGRQEASPPRALPGAAPAPPRGRAEGRPGPGLGQAWALPAPASRGKGGGTARPLPRGEAEPWAPRARQGGRGRRSRPPLGRGHHFGSAAPGVAAAPVRSSRGGGRPRARPRSSAASSGPSRARPPLPLRSHFACPHLTGGLGTLRKSTATEERARALAPRTERKRCL